MTNNNSKAKTVVIVLILILVLGGLIGGGVALFRPDKPIPTPAPTYKTIDVDVTKLASYPVVDDTTVYAYDKAVKVSFNLYFDDVQEYKLNMAVNPILARGMWQLEISLADIINIDPKYIDTVNREAFALVQYKDQKIGMYGAIFNKEINANSDNICLGFTTEDMYISYMNSDNFGYLSEIDTVDFATAVIEYDVYFTEIIAEVPVEPTV